MRPRTLEHFCCCVSVDWRLCREGVPDQENAFPVALWALPCIESNGPLVVVVGAGMAAGSQGVQMQMALHVRAEFVHQVADQDFAHLLVAKLDSLHQRTVLVVGIPVGRDHARAVGAGDLRYVERQPSVLRDMS